MTLEKLADLSPALITAFALAVVLSEYLVLLIDNKVLRKREGRVSLASAGLAFFPLFILNKFLLIAFMFWLYQFSLFDLGLDWYIWIIAWVMQDLTFWIVHWLGHNVRFFWCVHGVHHTPKEINLSIAFRGSFFDFVTQPHVILWLPLLGFNPFMVLIVEAIGRVYGILVHVNESWFPNKKRTWIENIFISPSAHRVHHSTNHIYLDRNYGETLSIWDKLFGTYQNEIKDAKPKYGVMKPVDSGNLADTQLHEFKALWADIRSCDKLSDKLKYLIMPPGWNHKDGGTLASQMREKALDINKLN